MSSRTLFPRKLVSRSYGVRKNSTLVNQCPAASVNSFSYGGTVALTARCQSQAVNYSNSAGTHNPTYRPNFPGFNSFGATVREKAASDALWENKPDFLKTSYRSPWVLRHGTVDKISKRIFEITEFIFRCKKVYPKPNLWTSWKCKKVWKSLNFMRNVETYLNRDASIKLNKKLSLRKNFS